MAKVGKPLIDIDTGSEASAPAKTPSADQKQSPQKEVPSQGLQQTSEGAREELERLSEHVLATPAVRRVAREENIDLRQVRGSGRDGRVLKEDVLKFVEERGKGGQPPKAAQPVHPVAQEDTKEAVAQAQKPPAPPPFSSQAPLIADKEVPLKGEQLLPHLPAVSSESY